jgi:hypothetical protein
MRTILISFLILSFLDGIAQKPVFKISLEGIGDNREFDNGKSKSQTIFGTLGSFELGTKVDQNSLFAGLSELFEFGSNINFHSPSLIMYYKYEIPNIEFQFGSFPRSGTINFPLAMLADTLAYYRPQIEGIYGKICGKPGHQLAFADWTGHQTKTVRESFMLGTSGEIRIKKFFLQNYILMNHLAHTTEKVKNQHIKDYIGYSIMSGVRIGNKELFHAELKAGILSSFYRERRVTDGFEIRSGFQFEGTGQYKKIGLKTTLHSGEELQFALGDPLYRFTDYLRTDMIWYFINQKKVKARFNWSFHVIDWKSLDHSQQLLLVYQL